MAEEGHGKFGISNNLLNLNSLESSGHGSEKAVELLGITDKDEDEDDQDDLLKKR